MENTEIWKAFRTTRPGRGATCTRTWEVSNTGRIRHRNSRTGIEVYVTPTLTGGHPYRRYLALSGNDYKYIHRIVATAYIPNPHGLPTVDHINGDKLDNRVENLRWLSYRDNSQAYHTKAQAL